MDMKMRMYLVACLLLVLMANTASSLRCYTCSQSIPGAWNTSICQNDPAEVVTGAPITDCPKSTFCYTLLQMQEEQVWSFLRGCGVENMIYKWEECLESSGGIRCDCATRCETDLCNDDAGVPAGYTSPCLTENAGTTVGTASTTSSASSCSVLLRRMRPLIITSTSIYVILRVIINGGMFFLE
ncbi:PREDICTED: uncharacterized protein LOC106812578 [Priapulus caudatus]|uniref:Uncharacterized protein LOC106812578 n=1 Tax=Priapulus caudatus TaxID=37621 RepID=A0ABM1EIE5_PRICU|nr:PREDICTED: uncharacterized protein LOC106812578 [Priapulus caudatus]